ncbi:hypothetical protein AAG570_004625 [Ranatra chinensis]|uniref:Uncharacterized protein n=1 Tax=Ranatra chinensis TaxID=642074 RepID=A0ABD0YN87_9HEMI
MTESRVSSQKSSVPFSMPPVQKAIFPRSVVYEVEYIKEQYRQQMMAALEKERARFEREMNIVGKPTGDQQRGEGAPSTKQDGTSTQPPDDAWKIKPPFWYDSKGERKYRDTNPDDYTVTRLPEPQAKSTLLEEIGMESEERYIPGEIYKDAKPDVNKLTDTHGGTGVWEPRDPGFYRSFDPSTVPRRTDMQRDVALGSSATPVSAQDTAEDEELPEEATAAKMTEDQEEGRVKVGTCFTSLESTTAAMRQKTEYVGGDHGGLGEDAVSWPEPPRYLHPWGEERARQFFLTGLPFRAEATRWAERNLPAFEGRFTKRSGKKTFFGLK